MKKKLNKLFMIISLILILLGITFLIISFIYKTNKSIYLTISLLCVILANIFSIIRNYQIKTKKKKKIVCKFKNI